MTIATILAAAFLSPGSQASPGSPAAGRAGGHRLPDAALPARYEIAVTPDIKGGTFSGSESIDLKVIAPTEAIVLNARDLSVKSAQITGRQSGTTLSARKVEIDSKSQTARILFGRRLAPGSYRLSLDFQGRLGDKLCGFYRAHFNDERGRRHEIAATQMEPADARAMFPCFDEPQYKATFKLTATVDSELSAISNAPVERVTVLAGGRRKKVVFAETPRMSTYLLALVVGEFERSEPAVVAGVPVTVWCVKGKKAMTAYALDTAARLLPWFNTYFGRPYPGAKLDLIAVPDFEAGAMENLGAITFRETLLLIDDKTASVEARQHCAGTIAHEMAHMWFGDLVTMAWWDDLWLNEAFATWMSTKAIAHLAPDWRPWDEFALGRVWAMSTDALASTRPIHFQVNNPAEASEMFDEITYTKGASILRMLEQFLGEKKFQAGVRNYIASHAWSNATTADLWRALGQASALPVERMMHGFVYQPGYPVLSLAPGAGRLRLSQERFYLMRPPAAGSTLWSLPVRLRWLDGSRAPLSLLLSARADEIACPGAGALIGNDGASGYYRVRYEGRLLERLTPLIASQLKAEERLALLADQWALAIAGSESIGTYLKLTAAYRSESDPAVVGLLIGQLEYLDGIIDERARPAFERFVRDRLKPACERLGWQPRPGESDRAKILRGRAITAMGTIGADADVIRQARTLFARHLREPGSVDADLVGPVTRVVAYNGGSEDYDRIHQSWLDAGTPEEEERNLTALALFQQPDLVDRSLSLCLSDEVRTQDCPHLLRGILASRAGRARAWAFLTENWQQIISRYPLMMVPRVIGAASSFNLPAEEDAVRKFFHAHPVPAGKRTVAKTIERIAINVRVRQRWAPEIARFLSESFPAKE